MCAYRWIQRNPLKLPLQGVHNALVLCGSDAALGGHCAQTSLQLGQLLVLLRQLLRLGGGQRFVSRPFRPQLFTFRFTCLKACDYSATICRQVRALIQSGRTVGRLLIDHILVSPELLFHSRPAAEHRGLALARLDTACQVRFEIRAGPRGSLFMLPHDG